MRASGSISLVLLTLGVAQAQETIGKNTDGEAPAQPAISKKELGPLEDAVKKKPTDPGRRIELALAVGQAGAFGRGAQGLDEAIALAPKDENVYLQVGAVYFRLGKLDEAITTWTTANAVKKSGAALYNLAVAYRKKELLPSAITTLEEEVALEPQSPARSG